MACVNNEPNGRKTIQFVAPDGKRPQIRLGKTTRKAAATFKLRVEELVSAKLTGHPLDDETSRWLAGLDDTLVDRLAAVGLTKPRSSTRLEEFLTKFMTGRASLKPESIRKLGQTKTKLLAFFEADTALRAITEDDAADWRAWLLGQNLSNATVKQHVGNAKTMFNEAARRGLVAESPLRHLKGGSTPSRNDRYLTPDEAEKVIEHCPSLQWRLLFALARYAGLRSPSETHGLTWTDVDWDKCRLTVRSPKTERHPGHEQRFVPIDPRLMEILQQAFDAALPRDERLIRLGQGGQMGRRLMAIAKNAGVAPWADAFQTLRRSCEKEWAMEFPQYAVSKWIGHSILVSGRHYANSVPDELFDRAAAREAGQNPVQHAAAGRRTDAQKPKVADSTNSRNGTSRQSLRDCAPHCVNGK